MNLRATATDSGRPCVLSAVPGSQLSTAQLQGSLLSAAQSRRSAMVRCSALHSLTARSSRTRGSARCSAIARRWTQGSATVFWTPRLNLRAHSAVRLNSAICSHGSLIARSSAQPWVCCGGYDGLAILVGRIQFAGSCSGTAHNLCGHQRRDSRTRALGSAKRQHS